MEDNRIIKLLIVYVAALLVLPFFGFAYDDVTTHAALTQEVVKLFNRHLPTLALTYEEAELVIQGSVDEDAGIRWMQHFYDPVYNRGLIFGREWMSSKEWAQNTNAQAGALDSTFAGTLKSYFGGEDDYSWKRAIYEYTWGDKKRGLKALGHILHLLEDATVPDHTRNDPHPPYLHFGSPYESWAIKLDRKSFNSELSNKPITLSNINSYFDGLAIYSNNYFFSKDTILTKEYSSPIPHEEKSELLSDGVSYRFGFGKDENGSPYKLVRIERQVGKVDKIYSLKDIDNKILTDYWTRLSRQAVLHGAGAIKLFFDEVKKEKQTKILYEKNKSWLAKQMDKFRNTGFALAGILYGSSVTAEDLEEEKFSTSSNNNNNEVSLPAGRETSNDEIASPAPTEVGGTRNDETIEVRPPPQAQPEVRPLPTPPTSPPKSSNTSPLLPIAGVGGTPPIEVSPPTEIGSPSTSSGTNNLDTTPPDVSLTVNECGQTLSSDGCLTATTTINVSWFSTASDLDYYELTINGSASATTSTSTVITASDNATTTISVRAKDVTGNWSPAQTQNVEVAARPVVINEIAWMGTSADRSEDEWIELYNPTGKTINLSGWTLRSATDNSPYISLSGIIAANSFLILERTDNTTISDITAHQTYTGAMVNSGEVLELLQASTTIDKTPAVSACSGWCGGEDSPYYFTMERYDPLASGENYSNWGDWASFLGNGKNADNGNIKGTPSRRNSINYFIDKSGTALNVSKTIRKSSSPYLIPSPGFTIPNGATLTIEPGVVIKFMGPGGPPFLTVNGTLKAEGTAADKIVFTSYHDDSYGGDINQNSAGTSPAPGDWGSIKISADGSVFDNTIVRYGGLEDIFFGNHWANIRVENVSVTIKNSTIEKAKDYGVWLRGGSGMIENNIFRENNRNEGGQTPGIGLVLSSTSTPAVSGNQFIQNNKGLFIESLSAPNVSNNSFTGNIGAAIESINAYPTFFGNTASGNGKNGISFQGVAEKDYSLSANLPYIFQTTTYTVAAGQTLTIPAGTIIKLEGTGNILVKGKLAASGTASQKIIFTSLHDDDCGISGGCGDTNGTTTAAAAGDWDNITFTSTAATSTLEYFSIRYGGNSDSPVFNPPRGALRLIGSSQEIKNGTVEKNYIAGIWMQNSTSTLIADSTIQDHTDATSEPFYGVYLVSSSTPIIKNTKFKNNETHIFTDGASSYTDSGGNTFE